MTQETSSPLRILVTDVFHFKHNVTVFVGALVGERKLRFPSQAAIMVDGKQLKTIVLRGRRMSGDHLPKDYVVVYTDEVVDLARDTVERGGCHLVFMSEQAQ